MPAILIIIGLTVAAGVVTYFMLPPADQAEPAALVEVTDTFTKTVDTLEEVVKTELPDSNPQDTQAVSDSETTVTSDAAVTVDPVVETPVVTATSYTNGTYSNALSYQVPENHVDDMVVSLTLNNDTVTAVDVTFANSNRESQQYQSRFMRSYETQVIGKNIDAINLSRVGGASLTSKAFNRAVETIKLEAAV